VSRRFSQAISEGDGISVVPLLDGDVEALAGSVAAAGAEAIAVRSSDQVQRARPSTDLPIVVRELIRNHAGLRAAHDAGADACTLLFDDFEDDGELLEELYAEAIDLGLDVAIGVRDEDELGRSLELVDPEILVLAEQDAEEPDGLEALERTFELLSDVPVGKLVIAESRMLAREQVLELERAGVDAVLVTGLAAGELLNVLAELTGR
jgi:indole-3-glycerol phosphate synthase